MTDYNENEIYDEGFDEFEECEEFEKDKTRASRRKNDFKKAIRKMRISKTMNGIMYDNIHQFSKNKITCDCPLCKPQKYCDYKISKPSVERRNEIARTKYLEYIAIA